jgi:copper chaperone CopZ
MLVTLAIVIGGCASTPGRADQAPPRSSGNGAPAGFDGPVASLWVRGMGCPQCANNVDLQLLKIGGVEKVFVDLGSGRVLVRLSSAQPPTREQLAKAIDDSGFTLDRIEMP